jgi:DNA-binding MarR family transcriptional regulator
VTAAHSDGALGLLVDLDERGPLAVRDLLGDTELCESDLHGLVGELRAAGLVAETEVDGDRCYRLTDEGRTGLRALTG